ncbi:2TM domain-containing protein [Flavobacterium sp. RNTU_13]|uniref:2TM domain-containing protein n=1 Tax=Flavobacterium sp. RNTU_13 TaxID=3375145 RepID=UPI0039866CB7
MKTEPMSGTGRAYNRLQSVKSFYTHLIAWITVNALLFVGSRNWHYVHPDFWNTSFAVVFVLGGLALLGHFVGVFGYRLFFTEKREQQALKRAYRNTGINVNNTNNTMQNITSTEQLREERARRKVKALKGFYKHLAIYIVVNSALLVMSFYKGEYLHKEQQEFWSFQTFSTAIFWGIGVLCHAFNTFGMGVIFGNDWEERKIKEYLDAQDRNNGTTTKWE